MTRIESILWKEIGLDAASIGSSLIERAARLRMKARGQKKVEDYCQLLEISREERVELIEAVVVNETWFFRDRDSFTAFAELVRQQWVPQQTARPLRLLSVPCSSGEEPYSLAMTLLDAGLLPSRFSVDAVDISARTLALAKRAVYGKNSFRGKDLAFRERYFRPDKDGYSLDPRVCGCVQFVQDNVISENFLAGREPYDFIFCRNLLIYFDKPTQVRALAKLKQMLTPRGVLFVGPAELPIFLDQGFVSVDLPMAFACRKAAPGDVVQTRRRSQPLKSSALRPLEAAKPAVTVSRAQPKPPVVVEGVGDLVTAQKLADAGQLEPAAELCEAHIRQEGPSAQVYYLLGLVRDAAGDPQADDFYRKALYLEPGHYESLWHLALLLEKQGDLAGARAYKRRAERAQLKLAVKT